MADIFQEVDEEVRRDKALEFWKKNQNYVIALCVAIVLASGGWRYYQDSVRTAAEAAGARYEEALALARAGKTAEADEAFRAIIAQGPAGYATLAKFRSAADLGKSDPDKAVAIFDALANDNSVDATMRDVARLRAAALRVDKADYNEMRTRLEPMAGVGAPFRNSARDLLAVAAFKAGDIDAAGKWLDAIMVDQQAPPSIRARAEALLGLVAAGKPNG
jgi:hypothetical protein